MIWLQRSMTTLSISAATMPRSWKKGRKICSFAAMMQIPICLSCSCPRFGSGEAKGAVHESVRGTDIYAMVDVTNYSLTYNISGFTNHMSPDDHFQDLEANHRRHRLPLPTASMWLCHSYMRARQHKRTSRESLDCAMMLEELVNMGVENFITFDAHDPRVQNAIPLKWIRQFHAHLPVCKGNCSNTTRL